MMMEGFSQKMESGMVFLPCSKPHHLMVALLGLIQTLYTKIIKFISVNLESFAHRMDINWLHCYGKTAEQKIPM